MTLPLKKISGVFLTAITLLLPQVGFSTDRSTWTIKDFWQETQLEFQATLAGPINNNTCMANVNNFVGCINGLNEGLLASGKSGVVLVPSDEDESNISGFKIVTLEAESQSKYNEDLRSLYLKNTESYVTKRSINFNKSYMDFKKNYVDSSNESYLTAMVYNGFLNKSIDPHTYITPKNYQAEVSKGTSKIGGVKGIFGFKWKIIDHEGENKIGINHIYENSAFERAGIKVGDIILSVDQEPSAEEMVKNIATKDSLTFEVIGSTGRRTYNVSRASLEVDSVNSKMVKTLSERKIGYITLSTFMDNNGCDKIVDAGEKLISSGAEGIILDLRDNGGGYVHIAQCINNQFLEERSLNFVSQDLETEEFKPSYNYTTSGIFRNLHAAVLINGNSASASEVVSTYLQAYRKAFIVGENSYGKGTMQSFFRTENNSVHLAKTNDKYYGPQGVSPQIQGIIPDIEARPVYQQEEPTQYNRERDLYDNAIANEQAEVPVMAERLEEVQTIKDCIESTQAEERSYEQKDYFHKLAHDNQEAVALATLDCAIEKEIPVFKGLEIPSHISSLFDLRRIEGRGMRPPRHPVKR